MAAKVTIAELQEQIRLRNIALERLGVKNATEIMNEFTLNLIVPEPTAPAGAPPATEPPPAVTSPAEGVEKRTIFEEWFGAELRNS